MNASLILPKKTLQKHKQTNKSFSFYKTKTNKQLTGKKEKQVGQKCTEYFMSMFSASTTKIVKNIFVNSQSQMA